MTSRITHSQHGISLGGFILMEFGEPYDHDEGFRTEVSADGTTWGSVETVVSQIISALSDGDLVSETHVGNRELTLTVRISGTWGGDVTLGEKALSAVVGKPAELVWQPADLDEPPTVFDVLYSTMDFKWDDFEELIRTRTYTVTLTALPWGRSAEKVVTPAVTPGSPAAIDSGSATTNWTAPYGPTGATVTVVSGAVTATYNSALKNSRPYFPFYGTTLRRTATINVTADKFVGIDWKSSVGGYFFISTEAGVMTEVRREPAPSSGYTRSWFRASDSVGSIAYVDVELNLNGKKGVGTQTLAVDQIVQANALPTTGTSRQVTRIIEPGGSVAAEGDVIVQHASAGLGRAIIHSHTAGNGYSPALSQWWSNGPTRVADATTVSGARNSLATTRTLFNIPFSALPEGSAHLWARVRQTTGTAQMVGIAYGVGSDMGGYVPDAQEFETRFVIPDANIWTIVPIARVVLPPRTLGPAGSVRVALLRSTVHDLELDEAWLFAMDKGRLTVVDCGTGTPAIGTSHNRLVVSPPSLERPHGDILVGTAEDLSNVYTPADGLIACDQVGHRFDPDGGSTVFTVTDGTTGAAVSFEHYARWRANAGS